MLVVLNEIVWGSIRCIWGCIIILCFGRYISRCDRGEDEGRRYRCFILWDKVCFIRVEVVFLVVLDF